MLLATALPTAVILWVVEFQAGNHVTIAVIYTEVIGKDVTLLVVA